MLHALQTLKDITQKAQAHGYVKTHAQLTELHAQLNLLSGQNPSSLLIMLLNKVGASIDSALDDVKNKDAALANECQESAQALFQSFTLTNVLTAELQKLTENNRLAQQNQRYYDEKKNAAVRRLRDQVAQLRRQEQMNAAELIAFNEYLREMLEKDFAVQNLPKSQQNAQTNSATPNLQNMMDIFANVGKAASSGDQEQMKTAAKSFIGFLIEMIVECIATVCKTLAPSIAPFISQMGQFAKGAFGQWFSSSMDKAGANESSAEKPATTNATAEKAQSFAAPSASANTAKTQPHPLFEGILPAASPTLNAVKGFYQRFMSGAQKPATTNPVANSAHMPGAIRGRNSNQAPVRPSI